MSAVVARFNQMKVVSVLTDGDNSRLQTSELARHSSIKPHIGYFTDHPGGPLRDREPCEWSNERPDRSRVGDHDAKSRRTSRLVS